MSNFIASKTANRLVQLFGRINRGRSDYGGFLLAGHDLNVWMQREQNIARLPALLRKQIIIGRHVQEGLAVRTLSKVLELFAKVLKSKPRDEGWVAYYRDFLSRYDVSAEEDARAKLAEERNLKAAEVEAKFALASWEGDYAGAARVIDEVTAEVARSDEKLAGWLTFWSGAAQFLAGDEAEARYLFTRAYSQLGSNLIIDRTGPDITQDSDLISEVAKQVLSLASLRPEAYEKRMKNMRLALAALDGETPKRMEESVRMLGQLLGFRSTRPDNEHGTGPDVAWDDELDAVSLGIELKTDKESDSCYYKKEIAQSQNHNSWLDRNLKGVIGTVIVGPVSSIARDANPDPRLFHADAAVLAGLRDKFFGVIRQVREAKTDERHNLVVSLFGEGWTLSEIHQSLFSRMISELPVKQ